MKKYITPDFDIYCLEDEDVITASLEKEELPGLEEGAGGSNWGI